MPPPNIPKKGFVLYIERIREEKRRGKKRWSHRTVGKYRCYMNGKLLNSSLLKGATAEPRGPGNNSKTGKSRGLRIEAGKYPLGTHGSKGTRYHSFNYHKANRPRPGLYVHETNKRSAILIHLGKGFKASVGCINLTTSLSGARDDISVENSFKHTHALITAMKKKIRSFPKSPGRRIPNAWLVIEGEP